ncbi:MAG: glycoside hydrolase family 15 protein [Chloroflexota bacterium]|nr:glycoside hydrolase family 15 protein [Chloroflexota bacterium]
MAYKGIGEYGIIGNMLSAALVGTDGSIDWCCLPHFDSPSVFAAILDDEIGGRFSIRPQTPFRSTQSYIQDTNVLQTTFHTATGSVTVTDFMPCYLDTHHRLTQFHEIHRMVRCASGKMSLEAVVEPRLNYARDETILATSRWGITASGGSESLVVSSSVPFTVEGHQAASRFVVKRGEKVTFILHYGATEAKSPGVYRTKRKLEQTLAYWRSKSEGCVFSGIWGDAILRSYLALHLMIYSPTGAIIAAPTTSLPEMIGGQRNWDYRFAWLRDASLTINALFHLGHVEEALTFFNWLVDVSSERGPTMQILYGIDSIVPPEEQELSHLRGYRNSSPVRIGNGAHNQLQLDVFGEVVDAAYTYLNIAGYISNKTWEVLENFIDSACRLWQLPDSGIWEVRGGPYHFIHSKLMCWVAVERGMRIAEKLGHTEKVDRWRATAGDIRDDIMSKGWNEDKQAFTQHYDTSALDASNLLMTLFGFLPVSDERIISTVERTMEELNWDGLLRRYRTEETDDGLSGSEGAFLWCSFWLVRILLRMDRIEEATNLYQRLLNCGNHLGLFSEMVDPVSGEMLGNFPQALNHLAVIITGLELTHTLDGDKQWCNALN